MYVLQDLWRGNISPSERFVRRGSDYQKTSQKMSAEMDSLLELLTPEAKKQLETVGGLKDDMAMMAEEDVFIYGFRLGARLMLDVVGDYKGQFCMAGE